MNHKKNIQSTYLLSPLALLISGFLSPTVLADDNDLEVIEVHGHAQNKHLSLGSSESLLSNLGVDFSAAGGVSNLPILNGLMGDRVKVLVDGADVTAACANHMNPPLSYISANQITSYKVVAGVSPISAGGDNIAGVISVNSISPQYGESSDLAWHSGYVSAKYSSIDNGRKLGVGARLASDTFSFNYQGSFSDADSYENGNGDVVLDTLYRAQNHSLTAAMRDDKQQLVIKLTHQKIPYQGFANQYMDMTDNTSYGAIAQYKRSFENSEFEGQVNWHSVKHEMGFFSKEKTGMMPMETDSQDISTQLKWHITLDKNSSLLLGQEYYNYRIDDWWPAIEGSTMMGPNDYVNINNGKRERIALFAEYESQINKKLWLNTGVRVERVNTQVDEVQAYNDGMSMMDMGNMSSMSTANNAMAANDFNNADRNKTDTIVDVNLLANYQITLYDELQLGLARKNRAPNLYERYSWGVSNMATTMIGWYGDANGYIGNPELDVETANTISATYSKTAKDDAWRVSANVWYTDVNDYIDANIVRSFNSYGLANTSRNILQFSNVDATLYGAKIDVSKSLYQSKSFGEWVLTANVTSTRGKRDDTNQPLYQIKPLHTKLTLSQQIGLFENALSWEWVDTKSRVDFNRLESQTHSYNLVNLSSKATFNTLTLSAEVTNLFDEFYELPLGGVSIAALKQDSSTGFTQLAGQGRSFNISASYAF
ncbi:iron complex outermembrane recepter protein [Pseudoalteromonas carrageenovora]|uniref:Iron complex outermembrane recepter protein n=1 Tax=Pseudoalteromonas carrageenovora IAM 12662 TaxID=1314868 RepID=A0A2K4X7A5_PSEVC|nr:TonB-dependent receptor [Pseudoalteromonas carrageenovora]MBE0382430.1 iron complex outermembrane recepter protein [Pseudoalteromonas carrageenovora IAM 12662]QBJ71144.1 iron complex outermembrane recepter protein [Pseudoalteromonas carrageenovora]GEB69561.1 TonB-dependent receptor [Pseudoalteromonas carrageenovora]SOU40218.1 TonB-dependent receptor [Pseudoalteromonas carrageenovora IAM 12662]